MRNSFKLFVMITAVAALSSCAAAPTAAPSETTSSTPGMESAAPPAAPQANLSLEELHQRYVATGLPCDWTLTKNVVLGAVESGTCRDTENGLNTFFTQADVDALLKLNAESDEPGLFLVGAEWVVGSEHPQDLITAQETMGGELWPADSPFFDGK
ncbi:hypothetical protein QMG61_04620 [Cryobacterium sp. PH31-AA6]|uniref:hypothetical protein n=1 Tax=Cryobacterium sp. PH31-AA6 TaxID=3046205 RepID=UPI0024BAB562|nr:hypothetical protein [Cryobacterium sp. PH31-AA6]MDJ0323047.1 hypothetical protein [Cryobacterium sp. PH31-AA6]